MWLEKARVGRYESADDRNIQYVLSITGDKSHDYLVKVSAARI